MRSVRGADGRTIVAIGATGTRCVSNHEESRVGREGKREEALRRMP